MKERYEIGQVKGKWVLWAFPSAVYYEMPSRAEAVKRRDELRALARKTQEASR